MSLKHDASFRIIAAATGLVLLAGCELKDGNGDAVERSVTSTMAATTPEPAAPPPVAAGPVQTLPLSIDASHPNGMAVHLESISAKPDETVVTMTMKNGGDSSRKLASNGNSYLFSADGSKLMLVPPENNKELEIPPGASLRAELVFAGALAKCGPAMLLLNGGENLDNKYASSGGFRIPIPLADAAFSADGSKKKVSSLMQLPAAGAPGAPGKSSVTTLAAELGARQTARGTVIALPGDVLFDFNKADIRADARPTLDKVAALISQSPAAPVTIEGHTDSKGDDAYNLRLSERRARSVRDYLKDVRSVAADRITVRGLGETRPAARNTMPDGRDNPDGQQKNRRVEVVIGKA